MVTTLVWVAAAVHLAGGIQLFWILHRGMTEELANTGERAKNLEWWKWWWWLYLMGALAFGLPILVLLKAAGIEASKLGRDPEG